MDPCLKGLFYKHFLGFKKCAYVGGCLSLCVPHVCWGPWKLKKTIESPGSGASGLRVLYRTSKALAHQVSAQPSLRFCFVFKLKESIFIDFDFIPCLNKGFKFKFLSLMPFLFIFIFFLYHFHQPINMLFLAYKKWAGPGCSFL